MLMLKLDIFMSSSNTLDAQLVGSRVDGRP